MIEGTITATDYLAAQRLHLRRRLIILCAIEALLFVLATVLLILTNDPITIFVFSGFLGLFAIVLLNWFIVLPRKSRRHTRQMKLDQLHIQLHWDDEALSSASEQGQARKAWRDYVKSRADQHIVLLYHADNLFTMIPARWFDSEAQRAEFLRLAGKAGG